MSWGLVADLTGALLLLLGALLCFAAAVGLLRFPDVLSRMHAATKPQTLGLLLLVAGVALEVRQAKVLGLLFLVAVLQLLTAPVSAHMVGRTAYRTRQLDEGSLIADELGDDLARAGFRLIDRDSVAEDRDLSSGDSGSGDSGSGDSGRWRLRQRLTHGQPGRLGRGRCRRQGLASLSMSDTLTRPAANRTPRSSRSAPPVLRRVAGLLAPYKGPMLLVLLAVVVAAVLTSIVPFLTRAVFDQALFPVDGSPVDLGLLGWLVAAMIAIPLVTAMIGIAQNYLTTKIGNSAMADLRSALFAHLQRMELAFFTATKTGAIQSRLANDVSGVRTVLTDTATTILQNSVTVISAFIAMVVLSWQLTVITLILMPLFVFVQVRVGRRRQRLARRTQESLSEMTAITEEALSVSGILLAKVFNRAEAETERYRQENANQTRLQLDAAMTGRAFFAIVQTFFAITPALIYLVGGLLMTGRIGERYRRADRRDPGGVHHLAGQAADAACATDAGHARRADIARAVRPDLRVPGSRAGYRRTRRRPAPAGLNGGRSDRVRSGVVPLSRAPHAGKRDAGGAAVHHLRRRRRRTGGGRGGCRRHRRAPTTRIDRRAGRCAI